MARAERNGMANSSSAKRVNHQTVGGVDFIGVLKRHLSIFTLNVIGVCCLVLAQGLAYAAPPPESGTLPNGINLNSGQAVGGAMVTQAGDQSGAYGVNRVIELAALVSPQSEPVSAVSANGSNSNGVDGTGGAKGDNKEVDHFWEWLVYYVVVFALGFAIGLGPQRSNTTFGGGKPHTPPRPLPPRLPH